MIWKLADAKNKFSKVVDLALAVGPQEITRRDETVIVVALKEFKRLTGKKLGLKEYLMKMPLLEDVSLERDRSTDRKVSL